MGVIKFFTWYDKQSEWVRFPMFLAVMISILVPCSVWDHPLVAITLMLILFVARVYYFGVKAEIKEEQ